MVNVRHMVNDVEAAITFYVTHLGFTVRSKALPAFADVIRGELRLLLSGLSGNVVELFQPAAQ
jgi:catechol 2,3-dioxygenase-like lactoylglutathione lyase family enzyme